MFVIQGIFDGHYVWIAQERAHTEFLLNEVHLEIVGHVFPVKRFASTRFTGLDIAAFIDHGIGAHTKDGHELYRPNPAWDENWQATPRARLDVSTFHGNVNRPVCDFISPQFPSLSAQKRFLRA